MHSNKTDLIYFRDVIKFFVNLMFSVVRSIMIFFLNLVDKLDNYLNNGVHDTEDEKLIPKIKSKNHELHALSKKSSNEIEFVDFSIDENVISDRKSLVSEDEKLIPKVKSKNHELHALSKKSEDFSIDENVTLGCESLVPGPESISKEVILGRKSLVPDPKSILKEVTLGRKSLVPDPKSIPQGVTLNQKPLISAPKSLPQEVALGRNLRFLLLNHSRRR